MNKKILIVEDNADSREILGLYVTKIGCQVIKASNSKEGITHAEAERPDLIFMDLDLPDVDGVKTTAILRQNLKTSQIPVVALTAWMSELWREGFKSGHRRLPTKTRHASDVKADDRAIHEQVG